MQRLRTILKLGGPKFESGWIHICGKKKSMKSKKVLLVYLIKTHLENVKLLIIDLTILSQHL